MRYNVIASLSGQRIFVCQKDTQPEADSIAAIVRKEFKNVWIETVRS